MFTTVNQQGQMVPTRDKNWVLRKYTDREEQHNWSKEIDRRATNQVDVLPWLQPSRRPKPRLKEVGKPVQSTTVNSNLWTTGKICQNYREEITGVYSKIKIENTPLH